MGALTSIFKGIMKGFRLSSVTEEAKKRPFRFFVGCFSVSGLLLFFLMLSVILLLIIVIAGSEEEANNRICLVLPPSADIQGILSDKCYKKSLIYAEEQTNVPWQVLAAVDNVTYQLGDSDPRGENISNAKALVEIGEAIQEANIKRDLKTGAPLLDRDGREQKTIFPDMIKENPKKDEGDKNINMGGVITILEKYHCWTELIKEVQPEDPIQGEDFRRLVGESCYLGRIHKGIFDNKHFSEWVMEEDSDQRKWMWGGIIREGKELFDKDKRAYGAVAMYKYLVDGFGSCDIQGPGPQSGAIAHLIQWDSRWAIHDYACQHIAEAGCAVTSLTMVLNFYGANVTPDVVADQSSSAGGATCGDGSTTDMYEKVTSAYYPYLEVQDISMEQALQLLEQNVPIIVGTDDFGPSSHLIVLTSKQGDTITIDDPNEESTTTSSVAGLADRGIGQGNNIIKYVRKK